MAPTRHDTEPTDRSISGASSNGSARTSTFSQPVGSQVQALTHDRVRFRKAGRAYDALLIDDARVPLILSQRGPNGGFSLARSSEQISMLDVVNAVDPMKRIRRCPLGNPAHVKLCPLHHRIDNAMDMVEREFGATSLAEVIASGSEVVGCKGLIAPTIRRKPAN